MIASDRFRIMTKDVVALVRAKNTEERYKELVAAVDLSQKSQDVEPSTSVGASSSGQDICDLDEEDLSPCSPFSDGDDETGQEPPAAAAAATTTAATTPDDGDDDVIYMVDAVCRFPE